MRIFALALATFALAACSGDGRDGDVEPDPDARAKTVEEGGDGVSAAEDAGSMGARQVSLETELYTFTYSYPREAGSRQGLRMVLDRRLEEAKTQLVIQAREAKDDAELNNIPFRPHSRGTQWKVVAKPEGWLSLAAATDTYGGGAHPNMAFDALVWSDAEKKSYKPVELFISSAVLVAALRDEFCDLLDAEREERRGIPVERDGEEFFDKCIDPIANATLVLDSSDGEAFDRLRFDVAPYAAGPYAEGTYEIVLPVTKEIREAVKPQYRRAFANFGKEKREEG